MIAGLSGSLISHEVVGDAVDACDTADLAAASRTLRALQGRVAKEMGPASSVRGVFDRVAVPLMQALRFRIVPLGDRADECLYAQLESDSAAVAVLIVTAWGRDPTTAWRESVRLGIGQNLRWCVCINGTEVRIFDASRTYSRRYAQFDLEIATQDAATFRIFWSLLHAEAFAGGPPSVLDRAVQRSEQFRGEVRASLQEGVLEALRALLGAFAGARNRRRICADPTAILDESLVVIYRILFLLFAEARGLVPKWHPVFRDSYTIESLRAPIERHARPPGLWESLQAIARLAHDGCRAGTLRVPPFNGRLFSPVHAPLAESVALDDGAVRDAMIALTTRARAYGRQRIAYAELGVEQLGGVYERILDFSPAVLEGNARALTLVRAGRRKATGTFYTPRALTEFLVRRTLAPLVCGAASDRILSLRVLDPAMGSGAFLVAACRYLAAAYESALVREGGISPLDVSDGDRASFRRTVAQRCLFGVDVNPMAVQVGRLSLWLATLAGDRPLTFLDHHLRTGNSLVGASLGDMMRQAPRQAGRRRTPALPLFDIDAIDEAMGTIVAPRLSLARDPSDTIEQVRAKEELLRSIQHDAGPLAQWKAVADLWCAEWFREGRPTTPAIFRALVDQLLGRGAALPPQASVTMLEKARAVAAREDFFHWPLEFPEVFYESGGGPAVSPGFDAVIGNPPWEMLRGDRGTSHDAAALTAFTRESGIYRLQGDGHANLYHLFAERALSLVRKGGRLGLVLPSGFAIDHGCAALRRAMLDATAIDTFVTIENRDGVFPIHRGLKFLLLAATAGGSTQSLPCRAGIRSPEALDSLPDQGDRGAVDLPRPLLDQFSGDQLAIPDVRAPADAAILSRIAFLIPPLSGAGGWNVAFGRELNASDDREHFVAAPGSTRDCPIVEGKQIGPFAVDVDASRFYIPAAEAARLLGKSGSFTRARLAYRDVASASNRLTLIAAVIPAHVVTTHTLFCVKGQADLDVQHFLCGVFNSFVANYLVRLRVNTHVTIAIIERLPVPRPPRDSRAFMRIAQLSRALSNTPEDLDAAARLQAAVATLYGCTRAEFGHVLDSFPLVSPHERAAAMSHFAGHPAVDTRRGLER
jgi:hypothetical protein